MDKFLNCETFEEEMKVCCDNIITAIHHVNEIYVYRNVPADIKYDIQTKGYRIAVVLEKYLKCQDSEDEETFDRRALEISRKIGEEMVYVHHFLCELNLLIMHYGDGPAFSKKHVYFIEPPIES